MNEITKSEISLVTNFTFNEMNAEKAKIILSKYPKDRLRSAILPLFDLAQRQNNGWLSTEVIEYVAGLVEVSYIRAYEVASFYSMFNLKPVGKFHVQVCGTTPCWLRGAHEIIQACEEKLNIKVGQTTSDAMFTLSEVECLGACVNAPMMQINDDYYEDLTPVSVQSILKSLAQEKKTNIGSQVGRQCSAPIEID